MTDPVDRLRALLAEVADLRRAGDLVEWDERVCMPEGGAVAHGEMLGTLRRLAHERFTADEVGAALDAAAVRVAGDEPDSDDARLVAVTARDFEKATRVPSAFVAEQAEVVSASQHAWAQARAASSFAQFRPHLERVIDLKRRYVTFFPAAAHPYDLLLDEYEPGMTTADVRGIFGGLRTGQVALLRAIAERPTIDDTVLRVPYAEATMGQFATDVITRFGFDWACGRQDRSVHPFATSFGARDVRITTRWVDGQPLSLLFGALHETGHALYEQGVDARHHRTSLEGGTSLGVHESQSRLWENLVGRSRPFWACFFPDLQARCGAQLGGVTVEQFYRAVNRVQPSLIRVEADEATYNLHVMLRVEIEIGLIDGTIAVADLPEIWAERMREFLGETPPDDARGVLQDIHWSAGLFGYFATYALGNLIAVQLWERFGELNPSRDEDIRRGRFEPLRSWLREAIHRHGRKFRPQELVERVCGSRIDAGPYLRYLQTKYGELYGL